MSEHSDQLRTLAARSSIFRQLFDLALPVMGLNLLGVLALAVDTAMCGRLEPSESALAALGFATQVVFLLMVAMMGLSIGAVALVARAHGAGDHQRVNHILAQATLLTIALSGVIAVAGNLVADPLLSLLGASGSAHNQGLAYLRPMLAGTVFSYLNLMYAAVLRGVGNTRLPFVIALGSNALNVLLNYGLILGNLGLPALGVYGAAWGTVLSHAAGVVVMIVLLRRQVLPGIFLSFKLERIDGALAREIFFVGGPAALDMIVINVAFMSIVAMLGRIDETTVAAHGVGLRIQALAFVPGLGVSQATSAMVGQALGRGSETEARAVTRASLLLCTAVMTLLGGLFVAGAEPIVALFDIDAARDPQLAHLSVLWIQILGYGMPPVGMHIALVGTLRGSGATWTSLGINVIATLIQVPLSAVLGFLAAWGAFGVWVAFPISFSIRMILDFVAYRRGGWAKLGARLRDQS